MDSTTPAAPQPSLTPDPGAAMQAMQPNAAGVVMPSSTRDQIVGRLGDVYGRQAANAERASAELKSGIGELREMRDQPKPAFPNLQDAPPPPKPLPAQEIANQMPFWTLMAVLGGMGTRQPLLNATKAMAAAVKGYHEGDMQGFETHLKQWDADTKFAIDKNNQLLAQRRAIMADRDATLQDKEAELDLLLKQHGIEDKGTGAEAKNLESMLKQLDHHEEQAQRLKDSHERMSIALLNHRDNAELRRREIEDRLQHNQDMLDIAMNKASAGGKPIMRNLMGKDGKMYVGKYNPATSTFDKIEGATPVLGAGRDTVSAQQAAGRYVVMATANQELDQMEAKGLDNIPLAADIHFNPDGVASAIKRKGLRASLTPQEQELVSAAMLFGETAGHFQAGARLTDEMFARVIQEFVPQPGDDAPARELKRTHRYRLQKAAEIASAGLAPRVNELLEQPVPSNPYIENSGGGTATAAPEGIDPEDWKHLTPEEQASWPR